MSTRIQFEFVDKSGDKPEKTVFCYQNGISDYLKELVGENGLTAPEYWEAERTGRDREDKEDYRVKLSVAFCFSNRVKLCEYYHNSSFLEYGGSPERAVRQAFTSQIDSYLRTSGRYLKKRVEDHLCRRGGCAGA